MIPVDAIIADSVRGEPDVGAIASIDETRSRLTVLLWSYHDVAGGYEDQRELRITIKGLPRGDRAARSVEYSIDEHSGNAYTAWLAMGSPQAPTPEQVAQLHAASRMKSVARESLKTSGGEMRLGVILPRQSIKLIEIALPPSLATQ